MSVTANGLEQRRCEMGVGNSVTFDQLEDIPVSAGSWEEKVVLNEKGRADTWERGKASSVQFASDCVREVPLPERYRWTVAAAVQMASALLLALL